MNKEDKKKITHDNSGMKRMKYDCWTVNIANIKKKTKKN